MTTSDVELYVNAVALKMALELLLGIYKCVEAAMGVGIGMTDSAKLAKRLWLGVTVVDSIVPLSDSMATVDDEGDAVA